MGSPDKRLPRKNPTCEIEAIYKGLRAAGPVLQGHRVGQLRLLVLQVQAMLDALDDDLGGALQATKLRRGRRGLSMGL